jgi:3D (Asp-Asp-Asp) domain-containing protein/predicted RNA binding protein YcfA (HicA-like mRNA interferase family)
MAKKTKLTIKEVQKALKKLGYYDGKIDGNYLDTNFRDDLRKFQRDHRDKAGAADGWYGPKTESALLPLLNMSKKTKLSTKEVQTALQRLGYYDGAINGSTSGADFRSALRKFQRDYRRKAGGADGKYGPKTESALLPLVELLKKAPCEVGGMRRWTHTYYYIGSATRGNVPMYNPKGKMIASLSPRSFAEAALEGTTQLPNGKLANVAHPAMSKIKPEDAAAYAKVFAIAERNGWIPKKDGYAGLRVKRIAGTDPAEYRATHARNFYVKKASPNGYPVERKGIPLDPWKTLATDTGRLGRHDPKFKRKGGVIPSGTKVFVLEFLGVEYPARVYDEKLEKWVTEPRIHDGWFTANDTGGGIFGAHSDVFVGT